MNVLGQCVFDAGKSEVVQMRTPAVRGQDNVKAEQRNYADDNCTLKQILFLHKPLWWHRLQSVIPRQKSQTEVCATPLLLCLFRFHRRHRRARYLENRFIRASDQKAGVTRGGNSSNDPARGYNAITRLQLGDS